MSNEATRDAARATQPAFSDEKMMTEASFQSLRAYRLARVANRRLPSQPESQAA